MDRHRSEASRWKLLLYVVLIQSDFASSAPGPLQTSSFENFGRVSSCPGESVTFTCTRTAPVHSWTISGVQPTSLIANFLGQDILVPPYTFTVTEVNATENRIISTVTVESFPGLNGVVLNCFDGTILGDDPDPQTITAQVFDTRPISLSSTQVDTTSTRLTWTVPTGAEQCISTYSVNISGSVVMTTTDTFLIVSTSTVGVDVNTPTTFTVASNPGGSLSNAGEFNIINNRPSPPTIGSVMVDDGSCSINSVTVNWQAPDNSITTPPVLDYILSCRLEGTSEDVCSSLAPISGTSFDIPGSNFAQIGTYIFGVRARNSVGMSDETNIMGNVSATTITSASDPSTTSATLIYMLSNVDCNGRTIQVEVQRCLDSCTCSPNFNYDSQIDGSHFSTTDAVNIPGLISGNTYCYRSTVNVKGKVVGIEHGSFVTDLPTALPSLNNGEAVLFRTSSVTYQCANSVHGFNGNSREIVATLDQSTGQFSVPQCSMLIYVSAIIAVVVIVVIIVVVIIIAAVIGYTVYKKHRKGKVDKGPVYEDPDDFKPEPQTAGNAAYGHVQPRRGRERQNIRSQSSSQPTELTSMSGPVYEEPMDFKPDPHTAGNVAYGHVQPLHSRQ